MIQSSSNIFLIKTRRNYTLAFICLLVAIASFYLWRKGYHPKNVTTAYVPPFASIILMIFCSILSLRDFSITQTQLTTSLFFFPIRSKEPKDIRQIIIVYPGDTRNPDLTIPRIVFVENICERYDPDKERLSNFLKRHRIAAVSFLIPYGEQHNVLLDHIEEYWGLIENRS